ncbi:MAG TPA: DUF2085 domain-containing protein [Planctomycetota bacterium]|nr:DUF2085 domain-containing protein [Planctomycetota bacterium]
MNDLVHWLARCVCRGEDAGFSELVGGSTLLCPRCSGVYAGLLAGLAISLAVRRRSAGLPPRWLFAVQIGSLAAMGVTGFASLYGLPALPLAARFAVGALFGQAIGSMAGEVIKARLNPRMGGGWAFADTLAYLGGGAVLAVLPLVAARCGCGAAIVNIAGLAGLCAALAGANAVLASILGPRIFGNPRRVRLALAVLPAVCAIQMLILRAWRCWWAS